MLRLTLSLFTGLIFGLGLVIGGMADPAKVQNFLDVAGTFDPSLAFVMGGAVAVTFTGYRLALRQRAPLSLPDLEKIIAATFTGMSVDVFSAEAERWIPTAQDERWKRPYTELVYQPMQEVLSYLRANGFKTYIVTGGGQDFVRVYSERVYGILPEQVVGTAGGTKYSYDADGKPILTKEPKLLLNDNDAGKPEGIHLMIGRRPVAAFGNSTGDQQMLEYTGAGDGLRLKMLVLHDDAEREYAYGPAQGLPDTKVGTFTQDLYDEAKKDGWIVISMKNDWTRIFAFEKHPLMAVDP